MAIAKRQQQSFPEISTRNSAVVATFVNRREMVSEAAYYIAEKRNFEHGSDLHDWLSAERQIDELLSRG